MLLWVLLAVMTAATVWMLVRPLSGASPASEDSAVGSIAVYRDQLREIDADRDRGAIGAREAEAARLEVQRRILKLGTGPDRSDRPASSSVSNLAWIVMIAIPLAAGLLYARLGSPMLPDLPIAARRAAAPEQADMAILINRVEERLRQKPEDGAGWEVVAPAYMRLGRSADARQAWRKAIQLLGPSTARLRGLVESGLAAGGGVIDEELRGALEQLRAGDPKDPVSRYWLAMAKAQAGKPSDAVADLDALLGESPADAPWRAAVARELTRLRQEQASTGAGPGPEAIAAAAKATPDERARMIAGMVDGLAARLTQNGRDLEGWLRLLQAYTVLGRKDDAVSALAKARAALSDEPASLEKLTARARELGLADGAAAARN